MFLKMKEGGQRFFTLYDVVSPFFAGITCGEVCYIVNNLEAYADVLCNFSGFFCFFHAS